MNHPENNIQKGSLFSPTCGTIRHSKRGGRLWKYFVCFNEARNLPVRTFTQRLSISEAGIIRIPLFSSSNTLCILLKATHYRIISCSVFSCKVDTATFSREVLQKMLILSSEIVQAFTPMFVISPQTSRRTSHVICKFVVLRTLDSSAYLSYVTNK